MIILKLIFGILCFALGGWIGCKIKDFIKRCWNMLEMMKND